MGFITPSQRYDVIAVGDVATDVIIRLPHDLVRERAEGTSRWLELPSEEKLPIERDVTVAAGGCAANVAVALARLGFRVGLATFLAHDHIGLDLLNALHVEHVDTRLVHVDEPAHTNRNFVLSFEGGRTILVRDGSFDYHWPHLRPAEVPAWLYLSSLGRDALEYQDQIADWLDANPAVRLAFQPGTFQIEEGATRLKRIYERAEIVLCEVDEARRITGLGDSDESKVLAAMRELTPHQVVLSERSGGAIAWDGSHELGVPPFPDASPPFDRTGAYDAFAATVVAASIEGMTLIEGLRRATVNFMSVSHELGSHAGLLRRDDLKSQLGEVGPLADVHVEGSSNAEPARG